MPEHPISQNILDDLEGIEQGNCTLFLGAGASQSARSVKGKRPPSGDELSRLIVTKFLKDPAWTLSLENAASLAASVALANRAKIEHFVKELFSNLEPSPAHKRIPWFLWRAIVTTNYDQLIEDSYKALPYVQKLFVVLNEEDLPRVGRSDSSLVALLKPHGCVSQPREMCLSSEDIHKTKQERRLLFSYIEMLHFEGPVIYIGYSLRDTHVLSMIYELNQRLGKYRKPILFVTHQENEIRARTERQWFKDALKSAYYEWGFEAFMAALPKQVVPAIGPSMIIEQLAPCRAVTFGHGATRHYQVHETKEGEWECWLTYSIHDKDGFAGIFFETEHEAIDIRKYTKIKCQLNVPATTRVNNNLEAFKLESFNRTFPYLLDLGNLIGKGWQDVEVDLSNYSLQDTLDVNRMPLRRMVVADTSGRVTLNEQHKIGIRNIRFE